MKSHFGDSEAAASTAALHLCEAYLALNERRLELDKQLMMPAPEEQEHELLWCELDIVLTKILSLITQLAAISSAQPSVVRAKAAILALLLRSPGTTPLPFGPEATALALSVVDEIACLT